MSDQPLKSLSDYSRFVVQLLSQPPVERSTVTVVPPNIKRNRIPAPEMSFTESNLPVLIQDIEVLIQSDK